MEKNKKKIKNIIMLIIGCLFYALAYNLFMVPNNFVIGGVSGLALVVNNFVDINLSLFIFVGSALLLVLSFIFLDKKTTLNTIFGTLLIPLFIYLTSFIKIDFEGTALLAAVYATVLTGIGSGLVFKSGFTTGGTDILAQIISKKFYTSMATGGIISDGIIILAGAFVFGLNQFIYNILILYLSEMIVNKILLGVSYTKLFYIVSEKEDEVKDFLLKEIGQGATILETYGDKKCILCLAKTEDFYLIKKGIEKIDNKAYFNVSNAYERKGGIL